MKYNILLSGDGGQGIQTIGNILSQAMIEQGFNVTSIPNYGLEQRGGVSLVFIKVSDTEIVYPRFSVADILLVLSPQAKDRTEKYIGENTEIIQREDYGEEMKEKNISLQNENIFFLKILTEKFEEYNIIKKALFLKHLEDKLQSKPGWEENRRIFLGE